VACASENYLTTPYLEAYQGECKDGPLLREQNWGGGWKVKTFRKLEKTRITRKRGLHGYWETGAKNSQEGNKSQTKRGGALKSDQQLSYEGRNARLGPIIHPVVIGEGRRKGKGKKNQESEEIGRRREIAAGISKRARRKQKTARRPGQTDENTEKPRGRKQQHNQ